MSSIAHASEKRHRFVIWPLLIGLCTPTILLFVGGLKLTVLRIIILCLVLPALSMLGQANRRLVVSDAFAVATAVWMIGATFVADGFQTSAFIEAIEFVGAYFIGRAYVYGPAPLQAFVGALKVLVPVLVLFAVLDNLSGRNIVHEFFASLLPTTPPANTMRNDMVRATATFDGSHWLGTFCAAAAAVFFYAERTLAGRAIFVGLSLFGCVLALSSAPLMAAVIVVSAYCYDRALAQFSWRWKLFTAMMIAFYVALSMVANDPVAAIISHLTFDPSNGWFRMNTWAHAWVNIAASPWFGYGFGIYGSADDFWDQASVDCVYLVLGLRFGLPAVALLVITNFTAFSGTRSTLKNGSPARYVTDLGTAFTLTLVVYLFVGLTIHFWNAPWSTWGFLVGIRAALKEYYLTSRGPGLDQLMESAGSARARVSRAELRLSFKRGQHGEV